MGREIELDIYLCTAYIAVSDPPDIALNFITFTDMKLSFEICFRRTIS